MMHKKLDVTNKEHKQWLISTRVGGAGEEDCGGINAMG